MNPTDLAAKTLAHYDADDTQDAAKVAAPYFSDVAP